MFCRDLNVVSLDISEDAYSYNTHFRLCTGDVCMETDVSDISNGVKLQEIKESFGLEESVEEIREILMQKIVEASNLESRNLEGQTCCSGVEEDHIQRDIDTLSMS